MPGSIHIIENVGVLCDYILCKTGENHLFGRAGALAGCLILYLFSRLLQ